MHQKCQFVHIVQLSRTTGINQHCTFNHTPYITSCRLRKINTHHTCFSLSRMNKIRCDIFVDFFYYIPSIKGIKHLTDPTQTTKLVHISLLIKFTWKYETNVSEKKIPHCSGFTYSCWIMYLYRSSYLYVNKIYTVYIHISKMWMCKEEEGTAIKCRFL